MGRHILIESEDDSLTQVQLDEALDSFARNDQILHSCNTPDYHLLQVLNAFVGVDREIYFEMGTTGSELVETELDFEMNMDESEHVGSEEELMLMTE